MTDDIRAEMKANRAAGKAIRQGQRLENATYTAVEVKALTKTAADLAYTLGRKETAEEIAAVIRNGLHAKCASGNYSVCEVCHALNEAARLARAVGAGERCGCIIGPEHTVADHREIGAR